jgi:hypothetical protein
MPDELNEEPLRQWALDRLQADGSMLMWADPPAGSGVGIPDLILSAGRQAVFLQLKMASWQRVGSFLVFPAISCHQSQKLWHRKAVSAGLLSGFLVGLPPPPELTPPDAVACFSRPNGKADDLWKSGRVAVAMLSSAQYRSWSISGSLPCFTVVDSWSDVRMVISGWLADVELAG